MGIIDFQQDLKQGMTINEALIKHKMTLKEVITKLTTKPEKETKKPTRPVELRNITKNKKNNTYYIRKSKTTNGKKKSLRYGTYNTLKEAQTIRDELIKNGWNQKSIDNLCKKHNITRRDSKPKTGV